MTNRSPFATLVFRGKRFDGATMPLEALPELAAYRELLAAVARELFLATNPGRVRLPKGFSESFRLTLTRIEEGSAVPIVEREVVDPQIFPFGDFFDTARDAVSEVVSAALTGAALPSWLTPNVAARFASFGRSLKDDESVILALPGHREGAEYTRQVRRRILLAGQGIGAAEEGEVASGRPGCRIPVPEQVESLKGLQDGWLDGEGVAYNDEALAWSSKLLESVVNGFELATPYIYPTPEGAIRAEWSRALWEISADLDWSRKSSDVRAVRLDADEHIERTFALAEAGQEVRLGSFLASHMRGDA